MKKAGLQTGVSGLTLIETLLAILILSSGIIFIAPAFLKSGSILADLGHRYEAELMINNLIVEEEGNLRSHHELDQRTLRGKDTRGDVVYAYEFQAVPQDRLGRLYLLTVRVNWQDFKENQITRSAYILQ